MEEDKKHIYVCLSECEKVVKVGITYHINTRVSSLKTDEGSSFRVLFCSEEIPTTQAKEVESKVNTKFKDFLIKGNEWYNMKPIDVIEYLINDLNLQPYTIKDISTIYPSWEENTNSYKAYKEGQEFPLIKEKPKKGLYSMSYLNGSDINYIGFCNYGDAKDFYFKYKHFVLMANDVVNVLYNIPKTTFTYLYISPKKDIYKIREKIRVMRDDLLKITDI